ncbi:MAG TPA: type II toxin-antitoxin system ParD family antitoxin, partial [Catalimonadaceae bacterium]|nr:type II toxin-antitoxin system ParD family antitoxin [Catalimonadaceae bacterium]
MQRSKSISLGNYFENFISGKINEGRFKDADEVIRAGLRLLEEEENRILSLEKAINEGIESGAAVDFDSEKHLELLKSRKQAN